MATFIDDDSYLPSLPLWVVDDDVVASTVDLLHWQRQRRGDVKARIQRYPVSGE